MEVFAQLKITSNELTPKEIESQLGIPCDRSWLKGDLRLNTLIKEKSNGWVIESKLDRSEEIQEHISNILDRLQEITSRIVSLSPRATVLLSCAIYSDETPSLYFDKNMVKKISSIEADFDIDLYIN